MSNADLHPPIISFQHCDPSTHILCFNEVLSVCPLCRARLDDGSTPLSASPVRLPSVFVDASHHPFSIVLKPTQGTFLQSYVPGNFLHVGLTSSRGVVYNFDEGGMHKDEAGWGQSIAVALLDSRAYDLMLDWDELLQKFSSSSMWNAQVYQDEEHNCFDFVAGFLNHVRYNQTVKRLPRPITREELCKDYIVTMTTKAAERIELHRAICKEGYALRNKLWR